MLHQLWEGRECCVWGGEGGERYTIVEGYQLTIKRSNDPENTGCS